MASKIIIPLVSLLLSSIFFSGQAQNGDQPTWANRNETGNEVITSLQFYFHDVVSGQNRTAVRIAQAPQTNASSTFFGGLWMVDDALTVGPEPSSKPIGRARGLYGSAGQADFGLIMALSYVFNDGIYDGSSFSLLSFNPVMKSGREMAVVGGTGLFRLARGYAIANTYSVIAFSAQAQKDNQDTWAKRVDSGKEVVTTLQFYFHDQLSGQNPSAIKIAQNLQDSNSLNFFGNLLMIDDALTVGIDPSSKLVGRARGLYGSAGQTDMSLIMALSYVFSDGEYDGSSFSLLSNNAVMHSPREMAVVGGTGLFRLARGYAVAQTYQANASGDAIVGYNVTIVTNV